jgi:molybdate transport system substrate-binding protein
MIINRLDMKFWLFLLPIILLTTGCGPRKLTGQKEILVAAAANLATVAGELAREFGRSSEDIRVIFSFGSSGNLAAQIRHGAPFDLYLPAARSFCLSLREEALIEGSCATYAKGVLVVLSRTLMPPDHTAGVRGQGGLADLADLADSRIRIIAIPNPEIAPYGLAARQALQSAGLWEMLEPRMVLANSVSHALQLVASENAEMGLVALSLVKGRYPYLRVDESLYKPIEQTVGVLAGSRKKEMATAFAGFLTSPQAQSILREHGYLTEPSASSASSNGL